MYTVHARSLFISVYGLIIWQLTIERVRWSDRQLDERLWIDCTGLYRNTSHKTGFNFPTYSPKASGSKAFPDSAEIHAQSEVRPQLYAHAHVHTCTYARYAH